MRADHQRSEVTGSRALCNHRLQLQHWQISCNLLVVDCQLNFFPCRQAYFESLSPGEQLDLRVAPPDPKSYTFQTTGESDTVMVLFGDDGGNETTVAADDDSGIDRNARFKVDLESGKQYVLRVRLYYAEGEGDVGVLYQ